MTRVVAFVGFKGSGKNTAAEALLPTFTSISFADSIKDALAVIFCWDRQMLEGITAESRQWREQVDEWWAERLGIPGFTPRWAMTHFGTDLMRKQFNERIWLLNIERRIMLIDGPVVITDARFPNEVQLVRQFQGQVYRIQRGHTPWWTEHAYQYLKHGDGQHRTVVENAGVHESEWAWLAEDVDAVIYNNGEITELHDKVRKIVLRS